MLPGGTLIPMEDTATDAGGRTARLVRDADGRLVASADTEVTDDMMFALIDSGRR